RLVHGNPDFASGLDLPNADRIVAEVLTAHPHDVRSPLTGIEQEREREPGAGTNGMAPFKLLDLALGPRMIAIALGGRNLAHIAGRIIGPQPDLDRELHQRAQ